MFIGEREMSMAKNIEEECGKSCGSISGCGQYRGGVLFFHLKLKKYLFKKKKTTVHVIVLLLRHPDVIVK